ncbi:hypothetical protein UFOVP756_13 [uncultured Caudovirales phage]|uniref:Uncharacterized protein n=1 Tax=uncultured Caudovirales phage TaxID=2100421 RepID=A0A6J7X874_9CAUD|nr:hypothetical protein UFOVP756_13 [uncultured Caudovirales phage]
MFIVLPIKALQNSPYTLHHLQSKPNSPDADHALLNIGTVLTRRVSDYNWYREWSWRESNPRLTNFQIQINELCMGDLQDSNLRHSENLDVTDALPTELKSQIARLSELSSTYRVRYLDQSSCG